MAWARIDAVGDPTPSATGEVTLGSPGAPPSPLRRLVRLSRGRAVLAMFGPAFVASVAYVDPGNFATDFAGGAQFGYLLLWVVLVANLIGMLMQYLSAKLGIVTGRDLAESVRARSPRAVAAGLWVEAEIVAMATDVAEFLGAAIGLNLLFGVPMLPAALMTGVIAFGILVLQKRGLRRFELAIAGLLGIVCSGFLYETSRIGPTIPGSLGGLVPRLDGGSSLYVAVGIMGATIMPHAIYLHSALTQGRVVGRGEGERRRVLRFERADVLVALGVAGLVNMAMLAIAAKLLHTPELSGVSTLQQIHSELGRMAGGSAALAFAVALLASGASSSSVGTYAGQVVMAGFTGKHIPLAVRRGLTMVPALLILAFGVNPTAALVLSQVLLSFGIPFALIPLVTLTSRRDVMGAQANGRLTTGVAWSCAAAIVVMNGFLIYWALWR